MQYIMILSYANYGMFKIQICPNINYNNNKTKNIAFAQKIFQWNKAREHAHCRFKFKICFIDY